jgi:hypothetical protein
MAADILRPSGTDPCLLSKKKQCSDPTTSSLLETQLFWTTISQWQHTAATLTTMEHSKKVKAEMKSLKKDVGYIRTPNQIIKANHYIDHILNSDEDNIRHLAWIELINTNRTGIDFDRIWTELRFYRIVGEPMANVLRLGAGEALAVDELGRLAERWAYLAANNALGSLEEHPDVKKAKKAAL